MNEPQKHRQSIRLKGYDYRLNGAYYITICSYHKQYLFGEIVEGNMERNLLADTVEAVWYRLPLHFKFIELDTFIVMPNHIHGIIVIQNQALEKAAHDSQYPHGTMPESLGAIVNFKSISTRKINFLCGDRLKICSAIIMNISFAMKILIKKSGNTFLIIREIGNKTRTI